jgi:hypothetical protein
MFIIVKKWKDKWANKTCHLHIVEFDLGKKRNKLLKPATA